MELRAGENAWSKAYSPFAGSGLYQIVFEAGHQARTSVVNYL
jgi:hypothetical protein